MPLCSYASQLAKRLVQLNELKRHGCDPPGQSADYSRLAKESRPAHGRNACASNSHRGWAVVEHPQARRLSLSLPERAEATREGDARMRASRC